MVAHVPRPSLIQLRPYQLDGVEAIRARIRAKKRRIIYVAPTGSGKTCVAAYIVASALERGRRVLFLAHRRELVIQSATKLMRMGLPPESIGVAMAGTPARSALLFRETPLEVIARCSAAGATDAQIDRELWGIFGARRPQAPIQVGSVDTVRSKELGDFDLVIIDECHRAQAPTYLKIIQRHINAVILGLTATPFPTGNKGLGDPVLEGGAALFEDLVPPTKTARELAELGFLVTPRMFGVPADMLPDVSDVEIGSNGDWEKEGLERATDTPKLIGDLVRHWGERAEGLRTVCFAAGVRHSRNVVDAFRAAGVRAEHLDGTTPRDERDAILSRLDRGETIYVSNVDILTTGWDQPRVAVLQFARRTRSRIYAKQMEGRGLRPHPEKPFALFLDHAAVIAEHGGPLDEEEYSLAPTKKKRRAGAVSIKTCPSCFAIVPSGVRVCPECQFSFSEAAEREDPETEDGELVEIQDATREEKRAYFDELCASRGSEKPTWVYRRFLEKFGTRVPRTWKVEQRPDEKRDEGAFWREHYMKGWSRGYKPGWASMRFEEEFGRRPSRELLAERDAWIERQGTAEGLEEQLRASVVPAGVSPRAAAFLDAARAALTSSPVVEEPEIVHRDLEPENMRAPLPPRPRKPVLEAWQ